MVGWGWWWPPKGFLGLNVLGVCVMSVPQSWLFPGAAHAEVVKRDPLKSLQWVRTRTSSVMGDRCVQGRLKEYGQTTCAWQKSDMANVKDQMNVHLTWSFGCFCSIKHFKITARIRVITLYSKMSRIAKVLTNFLRASPNFWNIYINII